MKSCYNILIYSSGAVYKILTDIFPGYGFTLYIVITKYNNKVKMTVAEFDLRHSHLHCPLMTTYFLSIILLP